MRLPVSLSRAVACVASLMTVGLSACASTGGAVTSPYLNTADGYFYKYGNFCGPGWPNYPADNTPAENIALIDSLEPVDDIDRVCRAHDRCYFEYGKNNKQCDMMLAELLRDHGTSYVTASSGSFLSNEFSAQCANLAGEILTAVGQFKQTDYIATLAGDDDRARNQALGLLAVNALGNFASGFPQVPGLCFFNDSQRAESGSPASRALAAAAASLRSGQSVSLTSFEPFYPADEASLDAGRRALAAHQAALAAAQPTSAGQ